MTGQRTTSEIKGKFDVAPLPGITGPGVSSLGGHSFAIAKYAENKGTALDFLKYVSSPEVQKSNTLATSNSPSRVAVQRSRFGEAVPLHADPAEVDSGRRATSEGGRVR